MPMMPRNKLRLNIISSSGVPTQCLPVLPGPTHPLPECEQTPPRLVTKNKTIRLAAASTSASKFRKPEEQLNGAAGEAQASGTHQALGGFRG